MDARSICLLNAQAVRTGAGLVAGAGTWYLALRGERDESNVEGMEAKVSLEGTSCQCADRDYMRS